MQPQRHRGRSGTPSPALPRKQGRGRGGKVSLLPAGERFRERVVRSAHLLKWLRTLLYLFSVLFVSLWFNFFIPTTIAQEIPELEPLTPVTITLNRFTPTAEFTFEAQAGEMWSVLVFSFNLELDPVVALYDSDGTLLVANDNETNASTDARIEGWVAPEDGTYRIEITRAGSGGDRFFGSARVTLLPGYSVALLSPADTVRLRTDTLRMAELPANTSQLYLRFNAEFEGDQTFWLQRTPAEGEGWRMAFDESGWMMTDASVDPDEIASPAPGAYIIDLEQNSASLTHDGTPVFTMPESEFPLFDDQRSTLEVVGHPANTGIINLSAISVTIPFYNEQLLATAQAPAEPGTRIYTFDRDSFQIMLELEELGLVEDSGAMLMQIPRGMITTTEAGFSTYPLNIGDGVQDFVLGFIATIRMDTPGIACGMTFRQIDSANFATALFSNDGSVYLLEYANGELTEASRAIATPLVRQGRDVANTIHVVARGEDVMVFINGTRLETINIAPQTGTMHLNIVLPEEGFTVCVFDNIWLWSLDVE